MNTNETKDQKSAEPAAQTAPSAPVGTATAVKPESAAEQSPLVEGRQFTEARQPHAPLRRVLFSSTTSVKGYPTPAEAIAFPRAEPVVLAIGGAQISFPLGLTVIYGATGGGKSTLLELFADTRSSDNEPLAYMSIVDEPYPFFAPPKLELHLHTHVDDVLTDFLATDRPLLCMDSLRGVLFETKGAAGSKGIVMPFFTALTRVSNSLALAGRCAVATINPMEVQPDFVADFGQKLSASLPGFMVIQSMSSDANSLDFTIAYSQRPNRDPKTVRLSFPPRELSTEDSKAGSSPASIEYPAFDAGPENSSSTNLYRAFTR